MPEVLIIGFCILMLAICLISALNPKLAIDSTIKFNKFYYKLFGFEIDIKSTARAETIYRVWGIFMFFVILIAMIAVVAAYILHLTAPK